MCGPHRMLSRQQRITASSAFDAVFRNGRRHHGRLISIWLREGSGHGWRVGVVAAKRRFRRAVDRNRAKRVLRESFRLNRWRLGTGGDVVLVARRPILTVSRQAVDAELLMLMRKAGIPVREER